MNIPQQITGEERAEREQILRELCQEYLEFFTDEEFFEDWITDYEHDIAEKALEYVFGKQVWDYINHYYK